MNIVDTVDDGTFYGDGYYGSDDGTGDTSDDPWGDDPGGDDPIGTCNYGVAAFKSNETLTVKPNPHSLPTSLADLDSLSQPVVEPVKAATETSVAAQALLEAMSSLAPVSGEVSALPDVKPAIVLYASAAV